MFLERRGVPTATVVTHVFEQYARGLARMQGLAKLPLVVLEHPVAARPVNELRSRIRGARPALLGALIEPAPNAAREPEGAGSG